MSCVLMLASWGLAQEPSTQPTVNYGAESHRLVSSSDEIVSVLENNLTVIVKRVPSPVLAVRAYAETGGVYEGKWLGGGLSHLLEHLVAGGTNARRSEEQNRNLLQQLGNNSNAYTTYDHTCFYVNTTPQHLDEAVDLVAGWMLGAAITPAEYGREYEVVQRELEMNKGEPDSVFWRMTQLNRYRISPQRVPVIGYQEVIQGLSRDDVYGYYKLAYQPNNLVFAVAGDVDPEKMLAAVQKNVSQVKPGREFTHELPPEPPVLAPRSMVATFPKLGQAKLDLGFPSVRIDQADMYPLDLLATILAGSESSILVQELRDKQHLVSGVSASDFTPNYVQGTFSVSMELDADKIEQAKKVTLDEIEKLKTTLLEPERIERAKTQMRTQRVKSLQTTEQIISSLATDYLSTGDPHFSDRYVERIDKVTAQQLQEVANKYLVQSRLLTTALIPAEAAGTLPKAEDLLRAAAPTTQAKANAEEATKITRIDLGGDVTLLHKRISTSPVVEVRMYSLGGLTAEDEKTNGVGKLTMDMLPRGTRTRSADQIAEFFDSIGGDLETDCGNNSWFWNMTCLKDDFAKAMDVYADVVKNPSFPVDELTGIKQRLLAGIDSQDADWLAQGMRFFKKSYFGPLKSPYQFITLGRKEIVTATTSEQMKQWYETKVLKGKRVLAIFGDVTLEQAQAMAKQYFAGPAKPESTNAGGFIEGRWTYGNPPPFVNVNRVEVQKTEQALAGVVIGYKSDSVIGDKDLDTITVADTMTSGFDYPTGYLFDILRGRGLVYVVHAYNMPGRAREMPGAFIVYAGCDPKNVNEVVDVILENIARCQGTDQDMQLEWFNRSKQLITTSDAMSNETPAEQASTAALDELYGLGYNYHDSYAQRINAVTIDQVRQVARAKLNECVITVSTPQPDLVNKKTGMRTYTSFPPVDLTPRGVQHDSGK
ncbi:MAG TPA: pitrilysin family protein [Tepidisphaeraceae bacterium]|nr:pitrilysin family protein [Tepidisphaeraceae bacterium]